ncbi:MAG TPA: hypothetical protein VEC39_04465 [Vicinamibacterales bacterium]|nr:hypothetical protein [Vicinamibacterales bacterium]
MSTPISPIPVPSGRKLAVTTLAALAIAIAILVAIVLPAEYAIDPLGTGARLGLTAMANPPLQPVTVPAAAAGLKPVANGPINQYGVPYRVDAITITLGPYDYIEYKYGLAEGADLHFSWTASVPVIHDFHGERADGQATTFDKSTRQESHGSFTAPFEGMHGWYWENPGGDSITISVKSAGFYTTSIEYRSDKTQVTHELRTP